MRKVAAYKRLKTSKVAIKVVENNLNFTSLNSFYLPSCYKDKIVACKGCSQEFIFSAKQMQYMYEGVKLNINVKRVLCAKCLKCLQSLQDNIKLLESKIRPKGLVQVITKVEIESLFNSLKEKYRLKGRVDYAKLQHLNLIFKALA